MTVTSRSGLHQTIGSREPTANRKAEREITLSVAELLRAAIVISLLVMIAFWPVALLGRSVVATDQRNPLDPNVNAANYGDGFVPAEEWAIRGLHLFANVRDPGSAWWQFEPGAEYLGNSLRAGEMPWWDPYVGGGTPAMANLTGALFFPPAMAVAVLGNSSLLRNIYYLLMLVVAGLFTYSFVRKHGVSPASSLVAGCAVALSGGLVQTIPAGFGQSAACGPMILFFVRRLLDRITPRRIAATAFAFAFAALASFPPILVGLFAFSVVYFVIGVSTEISGTRGRLFRAFALSVVLAIGLVSFQYIPAIHLIRNSPQLSASYGKAGMEKLWPASLLQLLGPTLMGGAPTYEVPSVPGPPSPGFLFYCGALPLLLCLLAGSTGSSRSRTLFLSALAGTILSLMKIFGIPPVHWIGLLPSFRTIHYAVYLGTTTCFTIALLASLGFERMRTGRLSSVRAVVASMMIAGMFTWLWLLVAEQGSLSHTNAWRWIADFRLGAAFTVAGIAAILITRTVSAEGRAGKTALTLVFLLLCVESVVNASFPKQTRADVWRRSEPYVMALQKLAVTGRIFSTGPLPANTNSAFRLMKIDSLYAMNSYRMLQFYRSHFASSARFFLREAIRLPGEVVLDAANIEFLLLALHQENLIAESDRRGYRRILSDDAAHLYRRATRPRYFFATDYRLVRSGGAREMLDNDGAILVEQPLSFPSLPNPEPAVQFRVSTFGNNTFTGVLHAPVPGLLYCSESDMPGWTARVNGREVSIFTANHAFRAVEVPSGEVTVEFRYWPPGLTAGLAISLIALLITIALFVAGDKQGLRLSPT